MSSLVDQLIKSPLIFFVMAAVVLIVLAILCKIPFSSTIVLTLLQRAGFAAFGVILIVFSVIVTPPTAALPSSGSVTQQSTITPSPTVALITTSTIQPSPPPGPSPTTTLPQSCSYENLQTGQSKSIPFTN